MAISKGRYIIQTIILGIHEVLGANKNNNPKKKNPLSHITHHQQTEH